MFSIGLLQSMSLESVKSCSGTNLKLSFRISIVGRACNSKKRDTFVHKYLYNPLVELKS